MNYHRGPYIQRGKGLGNFLGSILKRAIPVISSIGKSILGSPVTRNVASAAKQAAIDTSLGLVSDAIEGKNLGQSVQENVGRARTRIAKSLRDSRLQSNPPIISESRKRKAPVKKKKVKKSFKKRDIFD